MVAAVFSKAREPMNSFTHFLGACLALAGTLAIWLVWFLASPRDPVNLVGGLIFGFSMVALYTSSSIYHYVKARPEIVTRLRKLDHGMIFVLIAGTYTPLVLCYFSFDRARIFLIAIWAVALAGIVMKLFWLNAPRWLSTALYLLMGWAILFDLPAFAVMPAGGLILIAAGGIAYTSGAIIYGLKKPKIKRIGFHELFHLFVMAGSAFHFAAVLIYVVLM